MAELSGLEDLYISNNLLDTNPELRPRNIKIPSTTTIRVEIETVIITAVIFIAVNGKGDVVSVSYRHSLISVRVD